MEQSNILIYNWFDDYSGPMPGMIELDQRDFSKEQQSLIHKVMNTLALRDFLSLDDVREELRTVVGIQSSSNARHVLRQIEQQIAEFAKDDAVRKSKDCISLVSDMDKIIERLKTKVDEITNPDGHVNDLLLLLRGVRLIKDIHAEMVGYDWMVACEDAATIKEWLASWQEEEIEDSKVLVRKVSKYEAAVAQHRFAMPYVATFVRQCTTALPGKLEQLEAKRRACKQALEKQRDAFEAAEEQQPEPSAKKARTIAPGLPSEAFVARLRL